MTRTKIIATIGPASAQKETLREMIKAGMDIVRINFSHGTHESNGRLINYIKELNKEMGTAVGVMADFQGPRIRILVGEDLNIKPGEIIRVSDTASFPNYQLPITNYQPAAPKLQRGELNPNDQISKLFFLDYPRIINNIEIGNEILIEDGLMEVKVIKKAKEFLEAEVIAGGTVKNHKGVNIPDAKLNIPAVTEKDEKDMQFALSQAVDFLAFSFVSNGNEIREIREKIGGKSGKFGVTPKIVSKIERKEAIKNIDEIISASDMIMVARGDLGIELPESEVLIHQKEIIGKCIKAGKPVIVATQMLNSMIENPLPTRAEVSDVSNAVIDHADYVMLSGESANGKYPVEAVKMMNKIIEDTEASPFDDKPPAFLDEV
ncbi:MAG: pyruvate kinase [Candidatus Moranbacteria bacterium]|nr:pyruvate kinase [Candidatus Moranbacteria bacterium]